MILQLTRLVNLFLISVLMLIYMSACAPAPEQQLPTLIPRAELFGNPEKAQGRISPDGTRISYLAPDNGVLNIWVSTIGQQDDRVVTNDTLRGIRSHFWAENNKQIVYLQDQGGDENWRIYAVSLEDNTVRDLTPFENTVARPVATDPKHPDEMLISLNKRNPQLFDVYNLNLITGKLRMVAENPGNYVGWISDNDFKVRAAYAAMPDGGFQLVVRDTEESRFRELITWSSEDEGTPYGFTADGKGMFIGDSRGSDVTRLKIIDITTKEEHEIIADDEVDLGSVMINPNDYHLEAVSFNKDRERWTVLDSTLLPDFEALELVADGEFIIVARTHADDKWMVVYTSDVNPSDYYVYDRATKKGTFLFSSHPKLKDYTLAPMKYVEIKARDGLVLPSYLTLPPGAGETNLPLILDVHGGPWARDVWGYNPEAQWMANRGYAVLQVNFRGSTGFGKSFLHAADKEWGRNMQNDLTDAVQWAIDEGIADSKRLCIYGGSYGGYAVLAAAAFTPQLFACGVDIVGPSNLHTLVKSIPPYWAPMLKTFSMRMGDPVAD